MATHTDRDPAPHWDALVREHSAMVYRLAYRLTGNHHEAEDLTHDAFIRVFRAWDRLHTEHLAALLHKVTVNLYRDRYRRAQRITMTNYDPATHEWLPNVKAEHGADHAVQESMDHDVQAALMALPLKYREAVVLRDIHDFTYDDVAQILGISVGTVRSRLHRGRKQLRDTLRPTRESTGRPLRQAAAPAWG